MNKPQYLIDAEAEHHRVSHDPNATGLEILTADDRLADAIEAATLDGYPIDLDDYTLDND